jgi:hypothetical protein
MQSDKKYLEIDLGFLNEAKPRETQTQAASTYKVNWRNIAFITGIVVAILFCIWAGSSENPSSPSASYAPPPTKGQAQSYKPPASNSATAVNGGEFSCSRYDSNQADLMEPKNGSEVTQEEKELKVRSDALDFLKDQIDMSGVTPYSDQASIDRKNTMIAKYNIELTSFKAAASSLQSQMDTYNQQVQASNNYLAMHCRRTR